MVLVVTARGGSSAPPVTTYRCAVLLYRVFPQRCLKTSSAPVEDAETCAGHERDSRICANRLIARAKLPTGAGRVRVEQACGKLAALISTQYSREIECAIRWI